MAAAAPRLHAPPHPSYKRRDSPATNSSNEAYSREISCACLALCQLSLTLTGAVAQRTLKTRPSVGAPSKASRPTTVRGLLCGVAADLNGSPSCSRRSFSSLISVISRLRSRLRFCSSMALRGRHKSQSRALEDPGREASVAAALAEAEEGRILADSGRVSASSRSCSGSHLRLGMVRLSLSCATPASGRCRGRWCAIDMLGEKRATLVPKGATALYTVEPGSAIVLPFGMRRAALGAALVALLHVAERCGFFTSARPAAVVVRGDITGNKERRRYLAPR
mmetsp:Transcript_77892/g.154740  ORF Transcript_77892/g.154740 Transcript_77892/m.154740 type:complete len:280 (+) Transcript_77892:49-888(+)